MAVSSPALSPLASLWPPPHSETFPCCHCHQPLFYSTMSILETLAKLYLHCCQIAECLVWRHYPCSLKRRWDVPQEQPCDTWHGGISPVNYSSHPRGWVWYRKLTADWIRLGETNPSSCARMLSWIYWGHKQRFVFICWRTAYLCITWILWSCLTDMLCCEIILHQSFSLSQKCIYYIEMLNTSGETAPRSFVSPPSTSDVVSMWAGRNFSFLHHIAKESSALHLHSLRRSILYNQDHPH